MSDIVERLRNDQGIGINLTLCREAADEIERLRAALKEAAAKRTDCEKSSNELFLRREEAQSELNAAADEIERLREALKPFANAADQLDKEMWDDGPIEGSLAYVTGSHCRAARAALKEEKP